MTSQHPLTDRIPLNHYPYEKTMIIPLDKACDDQRDAFQESISEAYKLGLKTGRDEQLEWVIEWIRENLTWVEEDGLPRYLKNTSHEECAVIDEWKVISDLLKEAMRPTTTEENS